MSITILRGRVLTFIAEPQGPDDASSYRYWEDGAVTMSGGGIVAVGDFDAQAAAGAEVVDHRPHLIVPGFIDPHIHFPQLQVIGSYASDLLEWLDRYTFVEEQKFMDRQHAKRIAKLFFDELIRNGTTTASAYCSVHPQSVEAFFAEAARRDMLVIGGKVMMDRNAPPGLTDTPQSGYDETKSGIARWHGKGRALYAITPRFAITSSPEQMEMTAALRREHPDCYVQTHLSETQGEIERVRELFPNSSDYTAVYERYQLLGPKSLLGHCIHLGHREVEALAESGSVAVFCPTSNMFLGAGLFDYQRLHDRGVRIGIATDVGGGTGFSMLRTLDGGFKVAQLMGQRIDPLRAFYMATLGNARALSLEGTIGTIAPGAAADLIVLDAAATPQMAARLETVSGLAGELFLMQTSGDDRAVREVYIAGKPAKSTLDAGN